METEKFTFERSLSEAIWHSFRNLKQLENALPLLVLPFDRVWFEMTPTNEMPERDVSARHQVIADQYYDNMRKIAQITTFMPDRLGFLCTKTDYGFEALMMWSIPDAPISFSPVVSQFHTSRIGTLQEHSNGVCSTECIRKELTAYLINPPTDPIERIQMYAASTLDWSNDAVYLAGHIAMFHARNGVHTRERRQMMTLVNRKGKKKKLRSFRTLSLVLPAAEASETSGEGSHASPALHLVRGHFKAKKNGVFWWSPHWRGTPENGVIVKDYSVETT